MCVGASRRAPLPDHQRAAVHQRDQAPGQPGRLDAAGRRVRPVPAASAATRCCYICATDEHGTPAELAAARGRASRRRVLRAAARGPEGDLRRRSGCRSTTSAAARRRRTTSSPSTSPAARRERLHRGARRPAGVLARPTAASCPTATSMGTCPHCGYDRARGDQCENCTRAARPDRPDRSALGDRGSTELEVRETKHLFLLQSQARRRGRGPGSTTQGRLAAAGHARSPASGSTRACTTAASPATCDWGVPGRPARAFEGKVFYVWFDAPIEYIGATKEWADARRRRARDWKSWWYEADDVTLHAVHGQGQRPVPHGDASRATHARRRASRGSWSTTSRASTGSPTTAASSPHRSSAASSWTTPWSSCRPTTGATT